MKGTRTLAFALQAKDIVNVIVNLEQHALVSEGPSKAWHIAEMHGQRFNVVRAWRIFVVVCEESLFVETLQYTV